MNKNKSIDFETIREQEKKRPMSTKVCRAFFRTRRYISEIHLNIKTFIQRGKKGYANSDWWNFDAYISKIIIGCLKELKEKGHGLPTWVKGKTEARAEREWNEILDTIIYTFETAIKIIDYDLIYIPLKRFTWKEYKKQVRFANKLNKKCPEFPTRVMTKRESQKFEKGFDLFKEWFFTLWD